MKKVMLALMMAICTSLFSSCDGLANSALQLGLEEARKDLPTQLGDGMIMDDITLGDNGVVYHYTLNEELYDLDALETNAPEVKQDIVTDLKNSVNDDNNLKEFLKATVEANQPVNYKYEGETSGKEVRVVISVNEIKAILKSNE